MEDLAPHLIIKWDKKSSQVNIGLTADNNDHCLNIDSSNFRPEPYIKDNEDKMICIIGCPVLYDKIEINRLTERLLHEDPIKVIPQLNGQFIIFVFNKITLKLNIFNDRFSSYTLYYANLSHTFVAAFLYSDLYRIIKNMRNFTFNSHATFEFIYLQKLLGNKTYDNFSKYLQPASHLVVCSDSLRVKPYWKPQYDSKYYANHNENMGDLFIDHIDQSARRLTSDGKLNSLFLSGGHDSRVVLSAFPEPPICYTIGFSDNYEVKCARMSANILKAEHNFLKLDQNHFFNYRKLITQLCSGIYANDNAIFVGLKEQISDPESKVFFHGHGFDYMFQGMYLPAITHKIFNRPTFFRSLDQINPNIADFYLNRIPFRNKDLNLFSLIKSKHRKQLKEYLFSSVNDVIVKGVDCFDTLEGQWEYLTSYGLGRHYSYPNILSKMTIGEQRIISFDNDLFDFYCRTPWKYRVNSYLMRYALNKKYPAFAKIPAGNTGIAAGGSPAYKTSVLIARKIARHVTGNQKLHTPHAEDRTWPDRDTYLQSNLAYQAIANKTVYSEKLREHLPYFDWNKIEDLARGWFNNKSGGGKFMSSLISIDQFLDL